MDVPDVEVNSHRGTVHVVEELGELPRADQKPVLGVAVLAADLDAGLGRLGRKLLHGLEAPQVNFVVGDLFGHEARHHQDGIRTEELGGLDLSLDDADALLAHFGIARRDGVSPMQSRRDVRDHQAGVFDFTSQIAHLSVTRVHLEPGDVTEPELDAVIAGLFYQLEPLLEAPALGNHVVADGFFHKALTVPSRPVPSPEWNGRGASYPICAVTTRHAARTPCPPAGSGSFQDRRQLPRLRLRDKNPPGDLPMMDSEQPFTLQR